MRIHTLEELQGWTKLNLGEKLVDGRAKMKLKVLTREQPQSGGLFQLTH